MVGASTRHVDPGATLRIHSGVSREIDKDENFLRRYVVSMGVDPALVDAAAKIPLAPSGGSVEARWNGSVSRPVASTPICSTQFIALHESANGTKCECRYVRYNAAHGGLAEVARTLRGHRD
jgi:hypothetical protein